MKHVSLGGLDVSRLGLGAMSMSSAYNIGQGSEAESIRTVLRALELGVTHIDTAEIYGPYANEELVRRALVGKRDQVVLATKFGLVSHRSGGPGVIDSSPANIRTAVQGSLKRLGTDYIDLYYQHRVDPKTPIEEVAGAVKRLIEEGKVRYFGLSEASPKTIRRAHAVHPVAALQTEYSLWSREPEKELMPLLRELGIGFVPYSPLARGVFTNTMSSPSELPAGDWRNGNPRFTEETWKKNRHILDEIVAISAEAKVTPAQVALAWVVAQGENISTIPGTKRVARVEENTAADQVTLSTQQLERLSSLSEAVGDRYSPGDMSSVDR